VLRVLRTKDESIATLNGKLAGLEGVLEETRRSLAAANRALQEKDKEVDRLWREQVLTCFTSPRAGA
jgi:prefoldin subunit 5